MRRALSQEPALALSSLVRTGDNRFLRLGITGENELAEGFPSTAKELFRYKVVVIGSANVSNFSEAQLQLLKRFVSERGGSLLLLGGRQAFAEGGWKDSPLAELLPVVLQTPQSFSQRPITLSAQVLPTRAGLQHAMTGELFDE